MVVSIADTQEDACWGEVLHATRSSTQGPDVGNFGQKNIGVEDENRRAQDPISVGCLMSVKPMSGQYLPRILYQQRYEQISLPRKIFRPKMLDPCKLDWV